MKKALSFILAITLILALIPFAMAEDALSFGVSEDNTYWNETLSVGCTLGSDWYFLTQDEIMELNGYTLEMLDQDMSALLENADTFMDFYAVNMENGATVNVTVEKLSPMNAVLITEEKYIELSRETMTEALMQVGMDKVEFTTGTITLGGEEHGCIHIIGSFNEAQLHETVAVVKNRNNMVLITVASAEESVCTDVLASFVREQA